MLVARQANCRAANAFLTGSKVIWPRSSLKITKMSKKRTFAKGSRRQWVKGIYFYKEKRYLSLTFRYRLPVLNITCLEYL